MREGEAEKGERAEYRTGIYCSTSWRIRRLKLTNGELRSEYLLHKSHINIPCSEINL
jgi:hypothetical protein